MASHVVSFVASRVEALSAQIATIRLTVAVDPHVYVQVPLFREMLIAYSALVELKPLVRILIVLNEVFSSRQFLVA